MPTSAIKKKKSRGWHSLAKQSKFLLRSVQRGRKMTTDQALTTSHPILAAVMLQKPPQMQPRQKGRMRVVITQEPLVIFQKNYTVSKTLFRSREKLGVYELN